MQVKTNDSEALARAAARGLKVQTGVKAGAPCPPPTARGKPSC